jgi:hypothetical protein
MVGSTRSDSNGIGPRRDVVGPGGMEKVQDGM